MSVLALTVIQTKPIHGVHIQFIKTVLNTYPKHINRRRVRAAYRRTLLYYRTSVSPQNKKRKKTHLNESKTYRSLLSNDTLTFPFLHTASTASSLSHSVILPAASLPLGLQVFLRARALSPHRREFWISASVMFVSLSVSPETGCVWGVSRLWRCARCAAACGSPRRERMRERASDRLVRWAHSV